MLMWNIDQVQAAWKLAARLHKGQTYVGPIEGEYTDYLAHIGTVALEITHAFHQDPSLAIDLALPCAILHDTIEDTSATLEDIEAQFGTAIAQGVLALTKDESLGSKQAQMADSLARIKQQPHAIWAVKMADRIANLGPPPHYWTREKKVVYREEAILIHEALKLGNDYLATRLMQKIKDKW